jgi:tetratricopeptide (TPR) repeat protein/transcriptional regulator with XRE-family HTH domain
MSPDHPPPSASESAPALDGRIALDAALLKTLRKARGLSQEALAELCAHQQLAVSIASIKRAETGKVVLYRTARHLAGIFGLDVEQLVLQSEAASAPAAPVALRASAPQASAPEQSVRFVIELHIALPGAHGADSEALHDIAVLARQFGGHVQAPLGAQVVAVFGLPQSYRSDAERAMRCAIALGRVLLVHGVRAIALRLVRWEGGRAGPEEQEMTDLCAAAERQNDHAPLTTPVYVARNLISQLAGRFDFDGVLQRFPGFLHYTGLAQGDQRAPLALIGRASELRQFRAITEAALESRGGQIVYLRSMAGVGKTRLSSEFAELARQAGFSCHGCEVLDASADDWRAPLGQLARGLFGIGPGDSGAQAIDDSVAELKLPPETVIFYRAITGARMTSEQVSLYAAMSHSVRSDGIATALQMLIVRRALNEPLLLAIEDIHWGDAYLFEALGALLAQTREAPVLWVFTSRIEHDPLETSLRAHMFELALTVFDLAPLGQREALALADQFDDVEPSYRQRCVERAQGNPLFLTQLLASPEHHLPDSLKHVIQARLDALAPLHRRALRTASVIGHRFELTLLRKALGEPQYEPEAAGRNSLVRRIGPDGYAFAHDLVMHCIYESIDPAQQRRLHLDLAALYRDHDPALSAQHLYRADDPAAFDMMLRAIRDKLADRQFEAVLELTAECSANDSTRYSSFTLALLQAHATAGLGQTVPAKHLYQHALMLAGRPQEKIDAVLGLASTLNILEQLDEEERLIDDTLPLAQSIGADASLARLLHLKGNIYFPRGNYGECRRHHESAVRHAQASGTPETEARALSGMGDSYYAQGRMKKAHELFSQCIGMCEQHSFINIEASNRSALGSTRIYLGEAAEATSDALQSAELARKVGNRRAEIVSRMTAGWVLVATGQLPQAADEVARALELTRSMGAARFEPFLIESQSRISWLSGDQALAERQITEAAESVERQNLHGFIGPWVLGTLALFSSDPSVRKKALLQGAAHLTRDCLAHNAYRFFVSAAEVALLDGDLVTAGFYADQLAGFAASEPCAWVEHHVALVRHYSRWLEAPNDTLHAELQLLRSGARRHGFTQATPRLNKVLETF